jgi:mono/diheme cytochrome c family protein
LDAPALADIGTRLHESWMARWIENPSALRPSARMPRLLHGAAAPQEARDIAAFLASQGTRSAGVPPPALDGASAQQLFETLRCGTCHVTDGTSHASRISLADVGAKYVPGALAAFLREPNRHYAWTRMPDFGLTEVDANALAAWLVRGSVPARSEGASADPARGKTLVATRGCLNCHKLDLTNAFKAPGLAEIPAGSWASAWHGDQSSSARYTFTTNDRAAVRAFAATDRRALERDAPADFAASAVAALNCRGCHGQLERVPTLDVIGEKLRPEWTRALVEGTLGHKPRPWIEARMPAFPTYAASLASGLAAQHGYGPTAPADTTPIDEEMAEAGRQMVASGGCANCHNVAGFVGAQVATTAGINLATTADRLRYPFYTRWLLNPPRVWPETVMPKYFDKSRGPFEFYEHDATRQLRALWEYMRQRETMAPPQ